MTHVHVHVHVQGQAEGYLERLHKMVEADLNKFIDLETPAEEWPRFREAIIGMTDVTRIHFGKLVAELEKGLDAMLADYRVGACHMEDCSLNRAQVAGVLPWLVFVLALALVGAHGGLQPEPGPSSG